MSEMSEKKISFSSPKEVLFCQIRKNFRKINLPSDRWTQMAGPDYVAFVRLESNDRNILGVVVDENLKVQVRRCNEIVNGLHFEDFTSEKDVSQMLLNVHLQFPYE